MKTTAFDKEIAHDVEKAVLSVFECKESDILQYRDSLEKKVVVFFLMRIYEFNKKLVGSYYQMTHWYVPTVIDEIEVQWMLDLNFREKIIKTAKILNYEFKENMECRTALAS